MKQLRPTKRPSRIDRVRSTLQARRQAKVINTLSDQPNTTPKKQSNGLPNTPPKVQSFFNFWLKSHVEGFITLGVVVGMMHAAFGILYMIAINVNQDSTGHPRDFPRVVDLYMAASILVLALVLILMMVSLIRRSVRRTREDYKAEMLRHSRYGTLP